MSCNPAATSVTPFVATPFEAIPFELLLPPEFNFLIESVPDVELCPDAEVMALRTAAIVALSKGWYVFPAKYRTKKPYAKSHGLSDARNDLMALAKWNINDPANPCIQLSRSGLTVLDIDKHPFKSIEEVYEWCALVGLPVTFIVTSGRAGGGYHLYFLGVRTLPDCCQNPTQGRVGYLWEGKFNDVDIRVQGDIKCHGYVVAEGGLHPSGVTYRGNGLPIAPLPDFIKNYRDPKDRNKTLLNLHQDKLVEEYGQERVGFDVNGHDTRYDFWVSEAGHMRFRGYNKATTYFGLLDVALRFFVDAEEYVKTHKKAAKRLAMSAEKTWPCKRVVQATQMKDGIFGRQYVNAEIGKRLDAIPAGEPITRTEIEERIGNIAIAKNGKPSRATVWRIMKQKGFKKGKRIRNKQLWVKVNERMNEEGAI